MLLDFLKLPRLFKSFYRLEDRFRPDLLVPFKANSAQIDYLKLCAQVQSQKSLVWIIAIKPRRVGLTKLVCGIGTTMHYFYPGMTGRLMAHLGSLLNGIMRSYFLMAKGLPIRSVGKLDQHQALLTLLSSPRSTLVGSKALASGEGRGDAALFNHLDEAAYYPAQSPFTAMLPMVPRTRESFIGIVSTPNPDQRGIAFREMWDNARWVHEPHRDALFVRYFCPWMKDPYAFADPKLARDAPIDEEERILLRSGIGRGQLAWRRQEIRGRYRGKKQLFELENPADPNSCFLQVDLPAFSEDERIFARSTEINPVPMIATMVSAAPFNRQREPQLRIEDNGLWRVYERPQRDCEYYIGVDAARGEEWNAGSDSRKKVTDYAAVVIINGTTCATAAVLEARLPPDKVAEQTALAGHLYRTPEISPWHFALLNIALDGYGNEVQRRLFKEYGYPMHRFLRWQGRDDRIHGRPGTSIGWIDTQATNEMRLNCFRIALANEIFECRDSRLIEQICAASIEGTDAKVIRGHDDVLDAVEYAWIARDMQRPRARINPGSTQDSISRSLLVMANDGPAQFKRFWENLLKAPGSKIPANKLDGLLNYINQSRN